MAPTPPLPPGTETRPLPPLDQPIVKATDLGSVQVLKHGNLYLLTHPLGDVHPDSGALGLYLSDTRRLSCAVVRVSGVRPVLLRASSGSSFRGAIQLTNPREDRAWAVATRLLAPVMFSGWGVRTYAAGQPGYNPIG